MARSQISVLYDAEDGANALFSLGASTMVTLGKYRLCLSAPLMLIGLRAVTLAFRRGKQASR